MTDEQRQKIINLRASGIGYKKISKLLGLSENTVKSILTNEKYRGDALLQKQYTADFLQKTRKINNGEIPQYYVEEHHEAIIPPAQFDFVQAELARREKGGRYSGVNIFSNKIKCGCCGGWYGSKVWHSKDKYRKIIYRINSLHDLTGEQTEFREELWGGLVDHIRVDSEKSSTVVFRGGIEITI